MIKRAENITSYLSRISGIPFLGGRLAETACCYFNHPNIAGFYLVENSGAIQVMGDTVFLQGNCETDEINAFVRFNNITEVFSDNGNLQLDNYKKNVLSIMAFTQTGQLQPLSQITASDLVSAILQDNIFDINEQTYSDICMRINHCGAKVFCAEQNGQAASFAFASGITDTEIYLSFVFSKKTFRQQGFCKQLLQSIAATYPDKCVYLVCEQSLAAFYQKFGFEKQTEQYFYKKQF